MADEKITFREDDDTCIQDKLLAILERIARAQEGMLAIAAEARQERLKLSAQLKERLKQPFEGK